LSTRPGEENERSLAVYGRNIWALSAVSFLTDVHSEAILALLPAFMAGVLGLPKSLIGVIEGAAGAMASALQVMSGWLSDRVGNRKGFAVLGYSLSALVKSLMAFARLFVHVLAIRVVDRIGKGIRTAPRDALLADSAARQLRGRSFGIHRAADTLGAVVGSGGAFLLLGMLQNNYRSVFLWAIIPGIAAVVVMVVAVREPRRTPEGRPERAEPGKLLWTRQLVVFLAAHTLFSLGNFSYVFFLLRAKDVGIAEHILPLLYFAYNIVYAVAAAPVGSLSDVVGHRNMLWASYLVYAGSCLAMFIAPGPGWAVAGMVVYGLHSAMVNPAARAMTSQLAERRKGTGLGLYHSLAGLAAFGASFAAGLLWDKVGPQGTFTLGLVCAPLAALILAGQGPIASRAGRRRQR